MMLTNRTRVHSTEKDRKMDDKKQENRPDTSKNGLLKKFPQIRKDPIKKNRTSQILSKLKSMDEKNDQP